MSGPEDTGFPTPAVYISESGSDPRAGATYSDTFDISGNRFIDNWSGVFVWENSDRFAGSPANSSTGYTTLVNPGVATVEACGDPDLIGTAPYIDDCRWKSQHVRVRDNLFVLRPDTIGSSCRRSAGCGFSGLVSNYGTYPDWSPYQGYVVPDNITLARTTCGRATATSVPGHWMQRDLGNEVSWSTWRSSRPDRTPAARGSDAQQPFAPTTSCGSTGASIGRPSSTGRSRQRAQGLMP